MSLQYLHDKLLDGHDPLGLKFCLESLSKDAQTVICHLYVVFDRLKEEPSRISSVESRVVSRVMQIWNQAMSLDLSEVENRELGLLEETSCKQESTKSDERVTAPASHVAS